VLREASIIPSVSFADTFPIWGRLTKRRPEAAGISSLALPGPSGLPSPLVRGQPNEVRQGVVLSYLSKMY